MKKTLLFGFILLYLIPTGVFEAADTFHTPTETKVSPLLIGDLEAAWKKWEGKLDSKGQIKIAMPGSVDAAFLLQAWVFYKGSWRQVSVFWNDQFIWCDLGPDFKDIAYRIVMQYD